MCASFEERLSCSFFFFDVVFAMFAFSDPEDHVEYVLFCSECFLLKTIQGGCYCVTDDLLRVELYIGPVPVRRDVTRRADDVTSCAVALGGRAALGGSGVTN